MRIPIQNTRNQAGLVAVEFALIGLLLMVLLAGALEVGRMLFMWNVAAEASRLGARELAVCPQGSASIANAIQVNGLLPAASVSFTSQYLDDDGAPTTTFASIAFVEVALTYQHEFLVPTFGALIDLPRAEFRAVRPREALGIVRGSTDRMC